MASALAVELLVGFYFLDNHNDVEVNKLCIGIVGIVPQQNDMMYIHREIGVKQASDY